MIDYTERLTRAALARAARRELELRGLDRRRRHRLRQPIRLRVHLDQAGDHMLADWTGTAPGEGRHQQHLSFTRAASYTAIRSVSAGDIPNNEGFFRAIEVIAPPGTIANGVLPAACAARGLTGFRMVDCGFGAWPRCCRTGCSRPRRAATPASRSAATTPIARPSSSSISSAAPGAGGPFADGLDGNANMFANMASHSVEVTETEQPIRILAYEFMPDRPGPASTGAACRSAATTASSRRRACCRCAPTAGASGPTASTAAAPGKPSATAEPGRRGPAAAVQVHHDDPPRRRLPPRAGRRRRLGRPAGARPGARRARRAQRVGEPRAPRAATTAS